VRGQGRRARKGMQALMDASLAPRKRVHGYGGARSHVKVVVAMAVQERPLQGRGQGESVRDVRPSRSSPCSN
jgi:hypothetical protein